MTFESRPAAAPGIRQDRLIAATYVELHDALCGYVRKRIGSLCDAEDLVQDVFVRLLEYNTLLDEKTIVPFIYAMTRHRVIDWLRRHACNRAASAYFALHAPRSVLNVEERIAARDLLSMEQRLCMRLPRRRAQIYTLCVHEGRSTAEVAADLTLSCRTVENHLFAARQQIRSALRGCV